MSVFFKNREGQTPLEEEMRLHLKLKHVQDMTELYELESENIAEGIVWCSATNKDHMDYTVWLELHKQLLGNIWKFAGQIRQKELNNPDFLKPYDVRPALLQLEKDLKYWIEHKTYPSPDLMAIFHERVLTIHPFQDGNGRWSRVLTEFLCTRENVEVPNWGAKISNDEIRRKTYIEAIKKARHDFQYADLINIMW